MSPARARLSLTLESRAETIALARTHVVALLEALAVTDECIDEIRLAVSEACTNALEHAVGADYDVVVSVIGPVCRVRVVDRGSGFERTSDTMAMPAPTTPQGRGIPLMRTLMDDVSFNTVSGAEHVVRMTKHLRFTFDAPNPPRSATVPPRQLGAWPRPP